MTDDALRADRRRLHARGRCPQPRARARQGPAQGRHQARERRGDRAGHASTPTRSASTSGVRSSSSRRPSGRASRASRRGWRSPGTGGDVLFIEATRSRVPRATGLTLTGQLGDVMKESAPDRAQLRALARRASSASTRRRSRGRFHLHVPAGAVPKDGPSAGVTMTTAFASLLTGTPVRADGRA